MKKKKDETAIATQELALSIVMAVALLFLAVVLVRSAVVQLRADHMFSGCISCAGAVIFLFVSGLMFHDLIKPRKK